MLSRLCQQTRKITRLQSLGSASCLRTYSTVVQQEKKDDKSNRPMGQSRPYPGKQGIIDFSKLTDKKRSAEGEAAKDDTLNFGEAWTERNTMIYRTRSMPTFENEVDQLRYYMEHRLIAKSFEIYEKITQEDPQRLEIMDHLKVMDMYRTGRTSENNRRLKYIFEQIEKSGFPIAPAVYELMVSRVGRFVPEDARIYFDKFVQAHGASSVSLNAYGSLMLAYFRNGRCEEAKQLAEEAKAQFSDLHDLKPILMELELELGNEEHALKYFKDFIRNETGYLKIAKAYGWLANWYATHDRHDDAVCVIEDLSKRGININQASFNVLCKVSMARGQLEQARDFLNRGMEMVNIDRFGTLPTELVRAYLDKGDLQGAMTTLKMYRSHSSHIRELRYRPYYEVMAYLAMHGRKAEDARLLFNMIPHASRFRNPLAVRIMIDVYLYCNDREAASEFLQTAIRLGFPSDHPEVNKAYIAQGYHEGSLERVVVESTEPGTRAAAEEAAKQPAEEAAATASA